MDLGYRGKVVLVTGGARGVGAGICEVFAEEGANLVINYRSKKEESEAFAAGLSAKYGVDALAVQADVSREADVLRLFSETGAHFGTLDVLINNAATWTKHTPIEQFDATDFQSATDTNVTSVLLLCREFVKLVKAQKKPGHILNVLTKSVFWSSSINNSTYVATKGAVAALTRNLAHELAKDDIFVNAIIPGYVWNSTMDPASDRFRRTLGYIPNRRMGTPREMGSLAAFLCSERASQINGAMVDCSGGTMNGHGDAAIRKETDI